MEYGRTALVGWRRQFALALVAGCLLAGSTEVSAFEWSDNAVGWRYGTKFREPYNTHDITKNILSFTHADGWKYGGNFLNVDLLLSDKHDPKDCDSDGCHGKAKEVYVLYRGTLSVNKISGADWKLGPVRDWGLTFGLDWNTKNDAGYNSRKRMFVLGPTMHIDVPGFLDVSVLALWESNAPCSDYPGGSCESRYHYRTHPALSMSWGIPLGSSGFNIQGYLNWIASKGRDEFGGQTAPETHFDGALMYDLGDALGGPKAKYKIGLGYEYWRNKFGNPYRGPAGNGAFAKTPMVRAEFHF